MNSFVNVVENPIYPFLFYILTSVTLYCAIYLDVLGFYIIFIDTNFVAPVKYKATSSPTGGVLFSWYEGLDSASTVYPQ